MKNNKNEFNDNKNRSTKNLLNSYILNNYNFDNELAKTNSSNIINITGIDPIILFKKTSKKNSINMKNINNYFPTNIIKNNNYICDVEIKKKLDKFKLYSSNISSPTNLTSPTFLKNLKNDSKNRKEIKTMRYTSKKFIIMKKQKSSRNKEARRNVKSLEKYHAIHHKSKEKNKKKYNSKSAEKKNIRNENKKLEEFNTSSEKDELKNRYMEILVQNGILNVTKEFKLVKKLTPKEIIDKKKREYLNLNQKNNINVEEQKNTNNIKNRVNIEKFNIPKAALKNELFINNKKKENENININENNQNILINNYFCKVGKSLTPQNSKNHKKIYKPKINQFEYLNRIHQEQKKLSNNRQKYLSKNFLNDNNKKNLKLQNSFNHNKSHNNYKYNTNFKTEKSQILNDKNNNKILKSEEISKSTNKKSTTFNRLKEKNRQKLIEEMKDDEFPFSHRKSYRTPEEINKYLRDKKLENKKEEENIEIEKQKKIFNTFQNLCNIDNQISNITKLQLNYNNKKNKKENIKTNIKIRKEINDYYCGTELSRNSSIFIDKKEFYPNLFESQHFVANSKLSRIMPEMEIGIKKNNETKIENTKVNEIINENNKKLDFDINNDINNLVKVNNNALNKGFYIDLLEESINNSIQKAQIIFSEKNLNKLKERKQTHKNLKQIFPNLYNNKNHKESEDSKIINNNIDIMRKFVNKIKNIVNKNTFLNFYYLYLYGPVKIRYSHAFLVMIMICKRYQFKKIYTNYLYSKIKKETIQKSKGKLLFNYNNEHNKKEIELKNYKIKIQHFIFVISRILKYKIFLILFTFSCLNYKHKLISLLIQAIKKPYIKQTIEKIFKFINWKNIFSLKASFNINIIQHDIVSDKIIQKLYRSNIDINNSNLNEDNINNISNQNIISEILNDDSLQTQKLILKESSFLQSPKRNISNNSIKFSKIESLKFNSKIIADELTEYLLGKIINDEINNKKVLLPIKPVQLDNNLLNNNIRSNRNINQNILDHFDQNISSNNNYFLQSLFNQSLNGSEFSKTKQEIKRDEEMTFYVKHLAPILIKIICNEIRIKYEKIYDNISIPLKSEFEDLIIALKLKNSEHLRKSYHILYVKEELKDIIDKKKIISIFLPEDFKIRRKFDIFQETLNYDLYLSECIIDTAIELINNERLYGEMGEPFPFSFRKKEIVFKYEKNDSRKLIKYIYNSLNGFIKNPIFLIKDDVINFNDEKVINCYKKDLEKNEYQWKDLEITETQSKLEVSEIIMNQLFIEVIEILEHVQLNRTKPELYQYKSIFACEFIPTLRHQEIIENDLMNNDDSDELQRNEDDDTVYISM